MKKERSKYHYTVYLNATDEVVAFGAAKQCAKLMNTNYESFQSRVSKWRHNKNKKYSFLIEEITADDFADEFASDVED